jgi:hypothetical protein
MTNSGVPSFPQPGQYRAEGQQRSQESNLRVGRLDKAPNEIRAEIIAERRAAKLEGEITQVRQDGRINVRTPQGDVEVQLPADERHQQRPPQVGQRVEVEIQPPPQDAPEQPPQVIVRPAPSQSTQPVEVQEQPQPIPERSSSTPVQVEVRESDAPPQARPTQETVIPRPDPSAPPAQNTFPEIGSIVRLDPIAPQQLEQLIATRQIVVSELVQQALTQSPLPVLDVLPQSVVTPPIASNAITTISPSVIQVAPQEQVTTQVYRPTSQTPAILTFDTPIESKPAAPLAPLPSDTQIQTVQLPTITTTALNTAFNAAVTLAETQISVPVLSRAQAAIQHIQSLAGDLLPNTQTTTTASSIETVLPDLRVVNVQPPKAALVSPTQNGELNLPTTPPLKSAEPAFIVSTQKAPQITGTVIAKTETNIPIVQFTPPQNSNAPIIPQPQNSAVSVPPPTAEQPQTVTSFLQSEPLLFALQFPSETLITGSQIDVSPQSLVSNSAQISQSATALSHGLPVLPYANITFPEPWPAMQSLQQAIIQTSVQTAARSAQAFNATLPSPANPAQFAPAALFFMAAVRGGDLSSWLGERTAELLKSSGKGSLLSRLSGETGIGGRPAEAPSGEWRGMHIPLLWEGDIQKIVLHYKHDSASEEHDQQGGQKGTRFLFDLNLDGMGKVQLDGFFRPISSDGPRLDIILRTEERFSSTMQSEMRRLYMDAIKPSGVGGELSFQNGFEHWVMIAAENDGFFGLSA